MSEAKEKAARQTRQFHTEIVWGRLPGSQLGERATLADKIEEAYQTINDIALADDVVIVSTTQTVSPFGPDGLAVVITAQRVSRATLREMEMRAQIGQTVPPIKPVRSS